MSEPRGFLRVSLKGWTLNLTIDLKKCVGRLLRGGMGQGQGGKGKRGTARKPRVPRSTKTPMSPEALKKAGETITKPPVPPAQ